MSQHAHPRRRTAVEAPRTNGKATLRERSPGEDMMRWSDPFDQLSVGQRFRTGERVVTDTEVMVFSALTGDWHPQHCDPEWAARSPFGGRIAHGMLTMSLAVGLVPLDPELVLALRRVGDVVFKRPVRLNESIRVEGEISALAPVDEHAGLVNFGWAVRNQDDALVCRARVEVLWRRAQADGVQAVRGFWHDPVTAQAPAGEFIPVPL
jgi:3-hydroxybutyryl-CoA dehydratase